MYKEIISKISVEDVLRSQGADPNLIKTRSPRLLEVARRALNETQHLLKPQIIQKKVSIQSLCHERIELGDNYVLSSLLLAKHLKGAHSIHFVACTVGPSIDECVTREMEKDIVYGLAIDGLGSAAVETLANHVCHTIEEEATSLDLTTTAPLSPGMIDWPVEEGQPAIFDVLQPQQIGLRLTPQCIMSPRKSLTMLIGVGHDLNTSKRTCDYCAMQDRCRYKAHNYQNGR